MTSNRPLDPSRRRFLQGAGLTLMLPVLPSLAERSAKSPEKDSVKRFVGICETLGFHAPNFFPKATGADYQDSTYLSVLKKHRKDFSVFSGLSHPGVNGGHSAEKSFLSAAPEPQAPHFRNTISLDQYIADALGTDTRLKNLNLRTSSDSGKGMSVDANGQTAPVAEDPRAVFARMFFTGNARDTQRVIQELRRDRSLIDQVLQNARSLQTKADRQDRDRLDEYFTALRKIEKDLHRDEAWEKQPRPKVDYELPKNLPIIADIVGRAHCMLDLSALALRTDSTRSIALKIFGTGAKPPIPGVAESYHGLSHHGRDEDKIDQLTKVETSVMEVFANFLDQLSDARDHDGKRLLDNTCVLLGSNMGNASSHDNSNLPVLLAGGGFKHGAHHAFDKENNRPLADLYLTILHAMGIPADHFASGKRTLNLG